VRASRKASLRRARFTRHVVFMGTTAMDCLGVSPDDLRVFETDAVLRQLPHDAVVVGTQNPMELALLRNHTGASDGMELVRLVLDLKEEQRTQLNMDSLLVSFGIAQRFADVSPDARKQEGVTNAILLWLIVSFLVDWQLVCPNLELGDARTKILDEWGPAGTVPSPTTARLLTIAMLNDEIRAKASGEGQKLQENEFCWVSKTVWSSLQKKKAVPNVKLHREGCRHASNELNDELLEELRHQSSTQLCELCKSTQKMPILIDEPTKKEVPAPAPVRAKQDDAPAKVPSVKTKRRYVSSLEGLLRFPMLLN